MAARTYIVLNRKGGVGKTSTCFHLAGAYAQQGRCVLLIDMDPQANLTEGVLGAEQASALPRGRTVTALFDDVPVPDPKALIVPTPIANVVILPGSETMEHINRDDPADDPRQVVLRDFVEEMRDQYDVVLIDCPPNILLRSWSALAAGDGVVVPLQVEEFGALGLKKLNHALQRVRRAINPRVALLGYLITMINKKLSVHEIYEGTLREAFGAAVFTTVIPYLVDYKLAVMAHQPIGLYKPRSQAAKVIAALADELLARDAANKERKEVA
ncbi:MAG TPA: ParA family protein [Isosphaeraceae bacterium]|nr:ParA family protein [Isosphaeraceae bacterium]